MFRDLKVSFGRITWKGTTIAGFLLSILINFASYADYATVLIYHKFGEKKYPTTSVSMEDFKKQMDYLKKNNYRVIPLSKLIDYLQTGKEIPPKTVVITIDDGYRSTMRAYKLLKEYGFPFTVFLYMEGVARYPDYLTKEQLEQLKKDPLVEFGNHSYSHKRFAKILPEMSSDEYKKLIVGDTLRAEERLKKLLGYVPKIYAFPYGEYTRPFIKVLQEMGYRALFTQDPQNVSDDTPLWLIHRQPIVGSWAKMKHFVSVLNTEVLPVVRHSPDIGYLKENPPEVSAEVKRLENYKNCGIYISELGWIKAKRKGNILYLEEIPPLKRWKNRIGITCWNKKTGKKATFFWSVYLRDGK
ncbi:polysaccharide deacetylase family protein [Persephonella sp.]